MLVIEPCCAESYIRQLRKAIGDNGTLQFEGYGDLSLTELLPAILTSYSKAKLLICSPTLPDQAADIIECWLKKKWARMDGRGKIDVIESLTIVSDLHRKKSPKASLWMDNNPFGDRLTLRNVKQDKTVLLLPDFAIDGPINMRYGNHFIASATSSPERITALWNNFRHPASEQYEQLNKNEEADISVSVPNNL